MTAPAPFPEGLLSAAATLPNDPAFRAKVMVAVLFQARRTLAEEGGSGGNLLRLAYARQVLQDPPSYIESFAWTMAADDKLAAQALKKAEDITDALIFQRVTLAWDYLVQPLGTV